MTDRQRWTSRFEEQVRLLCTDADPAHDLAHFRRVALNAERLAIAEGADLEIVLPAAWLHDFVIVPKDSPQRAQASRIAADAAVQWLVGEGYPSRCVEAIHHAIHAHSFSAQVTPRTIEAKVVQDADRLDAIGAVGIARCLMLGGTLGRPLYDTGEPFPQQRPADDRRSAIDHFFTKLLRLAATMQTATGRDQARARTEFLHRFLDQLGGEIGVTYRRE
ncbi:MAG TPA: HD domain-containing protein [Terriglobales bacterium]|nr:HD domain-containing protein [Terriglobales bacterium]